MARSKRRVDTREQKPVILIVCEGAKTEPNYFKAFPVATVSVEVVGAGANTLTVLDRAREIRDKQGPFDQIWLVFDRDSFPADRVNAAVSAAEGDGMRVAWSNEAFELWYLLHFSYCDADLSRDTYKERLSRCLERPYAKNARDMYDRLFTLQPAALRNAERLLACHDTRIPARCNPATTVHVLVAELNKHRRR
jgi:hypothetical protein